MKDILNKFPNAYKNKEDSTSSKEEFNKSIGFEEGNIYYILFQVKDDDCVKIRQLIEKSIKIIVKYDAMISNIMSSVILIYYMFDKKDTVKNQINLVNNLYNSLNDNIKIVYGNTKGAVGLLGAVDRLRHGPIIPNLTNSINELAKLDFGKFVEIKNR